MIRIENIHKQYNKKGPEVLKGVNLEIPKGSLQVLLGANGSGKSTLVHIVSGIMKRNDGRVFIGDDEVTIDAYKYRIKVGYVFEQPMYVEKLTAIEQLEFVGKMYKLDKQTLSSRIEELISFFELPDDGKYIESYSKGMKSKVSLACALIHNPKYLILDEPFDGIDFVSIQAIGKLFRQMAAAGVTFFITSHQYDVIASLCNRFALLKDGQILFNTDLPDLQQRAHEFASELEPVKAYLESIMASGEGGKGLSWVK